MKNIVLLSFIFMNYTMINAQITVTGKVTDTNNQAIEFVNVTLINQNNMIITGSITDEKGIFTLSAKPGKYGFPFYLN